MREKNKFKFLLEILKTTVCHVTANRNEKCHFKELEIPRIKESYARDGQTDDFSSLSKNRSSFEREI